MSDKGYRPLENELIGHVDKKISLLFHQEYVNL